MNLLDRLKTAWLVVWSSEKRTRRQMEEMAEEVHEHFAAVFEGEEDEPENPFMDPEARAMTYESLDASLHALWPLISVSGYGGLMAYRAVIHGVLYAMTYDEDAKDQNGVALEVARVIHDYMPEDQSALDMPGIKASEALGEHQDRIDAELIAFLGAAIDGQFDDAVSVLDGLRRKHGARLYAKGEFDTMEDAQKRAVTEFLGSCMASMATQYVLLTVGDDDDDEE
jgi:hypothetical protein